MRSPGEAQLRRKGWLPFMVLNGVKVWVGPLGQLATKFDLLPPALW